MASFEEHSARKKPATRTVPMLLDPDLGNTLAEAEVELNIAKARVEESPDEREAKRALKDAEDAVESAKAAVTDNSIPFEVQAISRAHYENLVLEHEPTPKQVKEAERLKRFIPGTNVDTFPPALIQACVIDPPLTDDNAKEIWHDDKWSAAEAQDLFNACQALCTYRRVPELGKGSSATPSSAKTSTTADPEESPTPSS